MNLPHGNVLKMSVVFIYDVSCLDIHYAPKIAWKLARGQGASSEEILWHKHHK